MVSERQTGSDLDELNWATDTCYQILGTTFRVATQDPGLAGKAGALFADFESPPSTADALHTVHMSGTQGGVRHLYFNRHLIMSGVIGEELLPTLVTVINHEAISNCDNFAVHAAVVASRTQTIAMPAETGRGKTTLAAALVAIGFSYVSDEALVLDNDGTVIPYPKPLGLSPWSRRTLGLPNGEEERQFTSADLGGTTVQERRSLTDLVVARFGDDEMTLEAKPRSLAVAELLTNSFNHYKDPERAFRLATTVARRVNVWELRYSDPLVAAKVLRSKLG